MKSFAAGLVFQAIKRLSAGRLLKVFQMERTSPLFAPIMLPTISFKIVEPTISSKLVSTWPTIGFLPGCVHFHIRISLLPFKWWVSEWVSEWPLKTDQTASACMIINQVLPGSVSVLWGSIELLKVRLDRRQELLTKLKISGYPVYGFHLQLSIFFLCLNRSFSFLLFTPIFDTNADKSGSQPKVGYKQKQWNSLRPAST